MKWTKAEKAFVELLRVARVATTDSRRLLHNVPICPLLDDNKIYFGTEAEAKKVKNIKANPNVTIVFDEYTEAWTQLRGVMVKGKARVVNAAEFRRLRKKIYAKYLQYESMAPLGEHDSAIIEVTPEKKFTWGLES